MIYDYEKLKNQPPVQFNLQNPWANISGNPNVQASGGTAGGAQEISQSIMPQITSGVLNAVLPGLGAVVPATSAISKAAYSANNIGGDAFGSLFGYVSNPLGGVMQGIDIGAKGEMPSGEKIDTAAEQAEVAGLSILSAIPGLNMIPAAIWGQQRREREKRQKKMVDFVNRLNRQAGAPEFDYEKPQLGAEGYIPDMQNIAQQLPQLIGSLKGAAVASSSRPAAPNTPVNLGQPALGQSSAELLNFSQNLTNPLGQGFNINAGSLGFKNGGLLNYADGGSVLLPESGGVDKIALIDTESGQDTGIRVSGEEMLVISKETLSGLKSALSKGDKKKVFSLMQEQIAEKPNVKGGVEGYLPGGLANPNDKIGTGETIYVDGVQYAKYAPSGTATGNVKWYPVADKMGPGVVEIPGQKGKYVRTQEITKFGAQSISGLTEQEGDKIYQSQPREGSTFDLQTKLRGGKSTIKAIFQGGKWLDLQTKKPVEKLIGTERGIEDITQEYFDSKKFFTPGIFGDFGRKEAELRSDNKFYYKGTNAEVPFREMQEMYKTYGITPPGQKPATKAPFVPVQGPSITEQVTITETGTPVPAPTTAATPGLPTVTMTPSQAASGLAAAGGGGTKVSAGGKKAAAPKVKTMAEQKAAEAQLKPLEMMKPFTVFGEMRRPNVQMETDRVPVYESYFAKGTGGNIFSNIQNAIGPAVETGIDAFRLAEGLRGARATIPTWQPPQAWRDYVSEAGRMANMGLGSQQMANLQQQADRQYITDVANVRGLSGGNVGTLLGNLGRANMQRSQMQSSIAAMDQQARMQNQARFGAILGQDINLSRMMFGDAYTQAMMEKQAGAQLANQALQNMAERIDFERYYGPGSQQQKMNEMQLQAMQGYIDAIEAQKRSGMAIVQGNQYRPSGAVAGTTEKKIV